jgi:AcrR family transcriptional regulator
MLIKELSPEERVDPRVKRTRQLLVQAFNELLEEKSFDAMTVQDIADRATVNRATFYAHFKDKYALLNAVATESFRQALVSKMPPSAELNALNLELLIQIVSEYLEWHFVHCKPSIRTQFDSLVEQQVKQQLFQVLLDWLKVDASQDDAELRATAACWANYGLAMYWSQGERKETSSEFAHRALPLILAGLELPATSRPLK